VGLFIYKQISEFWCSSGKTVIPARRSAHLAAAERIDAAAGGVRRRPVNSSIVGCDYELRAAPVSLCLLATFSSCRTQKSPFLFNNQTITINYIPLKLIYIRENNLE
jgi:hypothetical protein